jgi:O-antigen/teichoic acid export membrane protein
VAVSQSVFPEISSISAEEGVEAAAGHIKDAIAYAGFIALPGFVGGALLADRLLQVYGGDFLVGRNVLWLLLLSILFFSYMKQFLNALNAIDEPRLAFAVNVVFIATNVALNGALIWQFGWVGAAVASATSAFVGLCLGYALLVREVSFDLPVAEITKQAVAALVMGGVVVVGESAVEATGVVEQNIVIVVGLVAVGAGVYVAALLALSSRFRATVRRNLPVDVPV